MGIEPGLLATSVNCIVSQRLARRLCTCKEEVVAPPNELTFLGLDPEQEIPFYRPRGCAECSRTGYRGRVAMYEVMPVEGEVRRSLERSTEEISAAALEQGMRTLRADGARLCVAGVTSVDEIRRVVG
jgi:type IV pilus assembly protein PilB